LRVMLAAWFRLLIVMTKAVMAMPMRAIATEASVRVKAAFREGPGLGFKGVVTS
jgi:hypothetical protein